MQTASDEMREQAWSRFGVLVPLPGTDTVGFVAADEAAARLHLSRRQVYILIDRIRCGSGTFTDLLIAVLGWSWPGRCKRRSGGGDGRSSCERILEAAETRRCGGGSPYCVVL